MSTVRPPAVPGAGSDDVVVVAVLVVVVASVVVVGAVVVVVLVVVVASVVVVGAVVVVVLVANVDSDGAVVSLDELSQPAAPITTMRDRRTVNMRLMGASSRRSTRSTRVNR